MIEHLPWLSGVVCAALMVLLGGGAFRRVAWQIGLIDRPKLRGVHAEPVARSGGLLVAAALLLALLAQLAVARALDLPAENWLADLDNVYLLLPAMSLLVLGLIDDLHPLGARPKLIVQVLCAAWAWVLGFQLKELSFFGAISLDLGVLSLPLTVLFVTALVNAFNMLDGIDGLCAGASVVALAGIGIYSVFGGELQLALALPLAAAAACFLRHNFSRPKAFLGDSGSMFLGFVVATLALRAVRTPSGALDVAPLLLLLSLPVVDITAVVARRVIQGANPFTADRGHIHHIMLILFGHRAMAATATLFAMSALAAGAAVLSGAFPPVAAAAFALPFGLYAAVYARGGYLSLRNLRGARAARRTALGVADMARTAGAAGALTSAEAVILMQRLNLTAIGLLDENDDLVWSLGLPDPAREALELPMYAGGRVRRGVLLIQGPGDDADRLAFAAQLLLPLYPQFMDLLATATRATGRLPAQLSV